MIKKILFNLYKLYLWPLVAFVGVFVFGVAIGIVMPLDFKLILLETVGDKFDSILAGVGSSLHLTQRIFLNNLFVSTIVYFLGFTITLPLFIMLSNGIIIGIFIAMFYRLDAATPGLFSNAMVSLIPHGIFELTAFFLAGALSCMVTIKTIFTKKIEPHKTRFRFFYESLLKFAVIIIPFLIIASFVEVYVSEHVGEYVSEKIVEQRIDKNLKVDLNGKFLSTNNCLLNSNAVTSYESRPISESLVSAALVIFDDEIYEMLKEKKSAKTLQEDYFCKNNVYISVQTWNSSDWGLEKAIKLQSQIYQTSGLENKTVNETPTVYKVISNSDEHLTSFLMHNQKTIVITSNLEDVNDHVNLYNY